MNQVEVAAHRLVIGDLAETFLCVACLTDGTQPTDYRRMASGEADKLAFPLVLERSRTDYQHALGGKVAGEDLAGGDCLNGLAESHFIADQCPSGARREEGAGALVGVELGLQQRFQLRAVGPQWIGGGQRLLANFAVADFGDETQRVFVAAKVVATGAHLLDELWQLGEVLRQQLPAVGVDEQSPQHRLQVRRKLAAETQANAAQAGVIEEQLTERSTKPGGQRCLAMWLGGELRKGEFDVLAGTEIVGREVRTRTVIVAGLCAANRHAIAAAAIRVENGEFGENGIVAKIFEHERLFAAELAAQRPLPVVGRQVLRFALAGQTRFGAVGGGSAFGGGGPGDVGRSRWR